MFNCKSLLLEVFFFLILVSMCRPALRDFISSHLSIQGECSHYMCVQYVHVRTVRPCSLSVGRTLSDGQNIPVKLATPTSYWRLVCL